MVYALEMNSINKSFGRTHVLKGINFKLKPGEVHALLGENGAGKSTLIKVLGGIHQPDSGNVFINGEEINIESVQDAQYHGIGIIHQEIILVPHLSVAENIFLVSELKTKLCFKDKRNINKQSREMMNKVGSNIYIN